MATLTQFIKTGRMKEEPNKYSDAKSMINNRLVDHESVIQVLRTDLEACTKYQDVVTTDFLTGLMEQHEKMEWMLRAFLEGKSV